MASILLVVTGTAGNPTPNTSDIALRDKLVTGGHTVTYFESVTSLPASGYDAVVITESGSANSAAITSVPTNGMPVLLLETSWNTVRMASVAATSPATSTQFDITAAGNSHAITSALADPLGWASPATATYCVLTSNLPSGATSLAVHATQTTYTTLAVAESGATLTTGTAPNRRAVSSIGIGSSAVGRWTAATDTLFLNIVSWLVGSSGLGGPLGVVTESDAAQPIGRTKTRALGIATETDAAVAITIPGVLGGPVGPTIETDVALPIGRTKTRAMNPAIESDVAGVVSTPPPPRFRFECPTYQLWTTSPPLIKRPPVALTRGISVVRVNGSFRQIKAPTSEQLAAAGVEGRDYFLGGYVYEVPGSVSAELVAAGYTTTEI